MDKFFGLLREKLLSGEKVQLTGFGTFLVKTRRERRGRNPKTGDIIAIRSRKSIFFRSKARTTSSSMSEMRNSRPTFTRPPSASKALPIPDRRQGPKIELAMPFVRIS